MGGSNPNDKILSYNDVVLRRSDLEILSGPHFLNDRIIEFFFSYLSTTFPSQDLLLVTPSISFWIASCPYAIDDFVAPLNLPGRSLILFPVNDNDDVTLAEGGSHWSLLVFHRDTNMFVHHDSSRGLNEKSAKRLFEKVSGFVTESEDAKYLECPDSPRQTNGFDCGLYVAAIARAVCLWHGRGGNGLWFLDVKEAVTAEAVSGLRDEILELIRGLMAT